MGMLASKTRKIAVFAGISMVVAALGLAGAVVFFKFSVAISLSFPDHCRHWYLYRGTVFSYRCPANVSAGAATAAGLAVVSCIGNLGGFVALTWSASLTTSAQQHAGPDIPRHVPADHRPDFAFLLRQTARRRHSILKI